MTTFNHSKLATGTWASPKHVLKAILQAPLINHALTGTLRHAGRPELFWRLPVRRQPVTGHVLEFDFTMHRPDRCAIAKELVWGNGRRIDSSERASLDLMALLAQDSNIFFDIGANSGIFTLACAAASPKLKIHAFEILPEAYSLLYENCAANNLLDRAECHHFGVGEASTVACLPAGAVSSSIPSSFSSQTVFEGGIRVGFKPWDSPALLPEQGARVLVKLDVEGTEEAVLTSGANLMREFRPTFLLEVLPRTDGAKLERSFAPLGYSYYHIRAGGRLVKSAHLEGKTDGRDWLVTCAPPDLIQGYERRIAKS